MVFVYVEMKDARWTSYVHSSVWPLILFNRRTNLIQTWSDGFLRPGDSTFVVSTQNTPFSLIQPCVERLQQHTWKNRSGDNDSNKNDNNNDKYTF